MSRQIGTFTTRPRPRRSGDKPPPRELGPPQLPASRSDGIAELHTDAIKGSSIITNEYRDNVNRVGDSAGGSSGQTIRTDAWITCYNLGDVHSWWNWSSFYGYVGGILVQGPEGFFTVADHHCT